MRFFALGAALLIIATGARAGEVGIVGPNAISIDAMRAQVEATRGLAGEGLAGPPGSDLPLGGTNEPTVAVSPLDPAIIAYASLFELRLSADGGSSFGPSIFPRVPPTHGWCGDASLAFDSRGRLFWTYLGCVGGGIDIFIAQIDPASGAFLPGYPVNVTASPGVNLPGSSGFAHDKEWLAADRFAASPFADRLYVIWTQFAAATRVLTTTSTDQGLTWGPARELSGAGEGFVWPVHNTVAANGDVFAAYHSQPGFAGGAPDGISGQVFVLRSTDGGATYPQKTLAYQPGAADITFNVQTAAGAVPGAQFWWQGSAQPWVFAYPALPEIVYVVAADDPDNNHAAGDAANVYVAISGDNGRTWFSPVRIDQGPGFQVMPTAGIDPVTGCIAVHYYDNRRGTTNSNGRYLLDVFATRSIDGGLTFSPDAAINDYHFDPDPGAGVRFPGPPPTTRIGEYNGVALGGGRAPAVWCGNTPYPPNPPSGQQIIFDAQPGLCQDSSPVELAPAPAAPPSALGRSRPNPAGPGPFMAEIRFTLAGEARATLTIYDAAGRAVRRLIDRPLAAGEHRAAWDGRDERGARAGSGVFYYRLEAGAQAETRKLVVVE